MSKESKEENMWDIVDLDDEAIEEYASNELLGQFLSNTVFRTGILCVILFNSILIAVETDQELVSITQPLNTQSWAILSRPSLCVLSVFSWRIVV